MAVGAKYQENHIVTCASSLSAASQQFCIVKLVATGVCALAADTDVPFGVVQNSPGLGEPAIVCVSGFTKLAAGSVDLAKADRVAGNGSGRAIAVVAGTSVGYYPIGVVHQIDNADNDGALVGAMIECKNPGRNN